MRLGPPLPRAFYEQPCLAVAWDLVGTVVVHRLPDGTRLAGRLVETEAYLGDGSDPGAHSHRGMTPRNRTMFGPAGDQHPHLFICRPFDNLPATWSNGYHIAFNAPDTETVDRFHATALAEGGYDEGAPGIRTEYAADYYGAYARDPDGNKICVLHRMS